jgi:nucleotide-binding universal stress UspA family protein
MLAIKRILVSVDLQEPADRVLNYAVDLAKTLGASLTVLHVYNLPIYNFPDGTFVPTAEIAGQVSDAAQRQLDATVANLKTKQVEASGVLRSGSPPQTICDVAIEVGADLIVMGTHGRGALARALLGSTANAVVRSAPVPVITLRDNADA